jgi:hypothetical protein
LLPLQIQPLQMLFCGWGYLKGFLSKFDV